MTPKIIAFGLTFIVNVLVGAVVFFLMLIAMNGFSESDANYGFATYILLALIVSVGMSAAAFITTRALIRRQFKSISAVMISVPIFSAVGAGLKIVCCIIALLVADYVRVHF